MAVVQISRIQVRRGQKNSNSGVPQLSSAEFAWAVDTQELYIGNGSVAEGAPYVGNTKVLTEHDNLLDFISSYNFAAGDPSIFESVNRPLQGKLDETVSVLDFGAVGDGSTDCTVAFQRALDQLFKNSNLDYRKVLMVPNGEYFFDDELDIPSGAIIRGETRNGAVLNINSQRVRFVTTDNKSYVDFDSSNYPENIAIENLTITRTSGYIDFSGVQNSLVKDVTVSGDYVPGSVDSTQQLTSTDYAVFWLNDRVGTRVDQLKFLGCEFKDNAISIRATQTAVFESQVYIEDSKFFVNDTGILIIGVANQKNSWKIHNTEFEEIYLQAFKSTNGIGTKISDCKFKNCSNAGLASAFPQTPVVFYEQSQNNIVVDSWFDRQQDAGIVTVETKAYIAEVENSSRSVLVNRNYSDIVGSDSFRPFAVFSAFNRYYVIDYGLELGNYFRTGQLTISLGTDLAGTDSVSRPSLTDSFQYSPSLTTSLGGSIMTNFEFSVGIADNDGDSGIETLILYYKNPLPAATGKINSNVTYGV